MRGLTLGKYAPLHRGHQLVIETGLSEMDEMIVIIYDAPDTTTIPLAVRSGWLRALFPGAHVIEAWDGPREVGYTPEMMQLHERYVIDTLGVKEITHFYSSEPYGEHMSRALGAVDRRVDEARQHVPVSSTLVRKDPFKYREYVVPLVYRDLITNVVFLGAPGIGKSKLAERLAREFDTQWVPGIDSEYGERYQVNRRLTPEQLVEIAKTRLERENALLERANRYLFNADNAIMTATFARLYHGKVHPHLAALTDRALTRYDLFFVCEIDCPYDATWDRSKEVTPSVFQRQVVGELNQRKIPFVMLGGTLAQRIARVRGVLNRFEKYMNILDRFEDIDNERSS